MGRNALRLELLQLLAKKAKKMSNEEAQSSLKSHHLGIMPNNLFIIEKTLWL